MCSASVREIKPIYLRTLRLKVKPESFSWLDAAAIEVNQVWNYCKEMSTRAAQPFAGRPKWLSGYDLNNLTSGATECFERIGAATIQRICGEYAIRRKQYKKPLRWRRSRSPKRSLGWVPYKVEQIKLKGKCLRFCGKSIRVFEQGDWWLCMPVEQPVEMTYAPYDAVGLDLGLRETVRNRGQ